METQRIIPEYISSLNVAEVLIRRGLALADATPFLAHCALTESDQTRFVSSFKTFLQGDAARIPEAFCRWPLASVWNFSNALSKDYGEEGHAVYAILDSTFGVNILGDVRNKISLSFRSICRKFGLCYEGSGRLVNDYLAQAGIANAQLHHVAKAFLFAERAFGPPPEDNTAALNSWEDDALTFLPFGVNIPRMVIEVDQSAHYAFLYARFRQGEAPRNDFETRFFEEIKSAQSAIAGGYRSQAVPRPSLIWSQNGLALALPKLEGRLSVTVGGETRKLRGGQNWPLPMPWPTHVDWSCGEHCERFPIFGSDRHILAFDTESGRVVGQVDPVRDALVSIDAREIIFAATCPFSVDDEPAFPVGQDGYADHCTLGPRGAIITIGLRPIRVIAKPKPRIWVDRGSVAKGPKGLLLSGQSSLGIDIGELEDETFDLAIAVGSREEIIPFALSPEAPYTTLELVDLVSPTTDLVPIRAELRLHQSNRALVRFKAWLWSSLSELRDGLTFVSDGVPRNYSPEYSRHIAADGAGRLCLDTEAAYETATLAFQSGHDRIEFDIPRPGVSLSYTDVEGRSFPIKIGDTLVVGDEDKGGSLSIRCPDKGALLTVRGRRELEAFKRTTTRVLSVAELIAPAAKDDITLEGAATAGIAIVLAKIVPAAAPMIFSVARKYHTLSLTLETKIDIDAIRFFVENQIGASENFDVAVGRYPVTFTTPNWLDATLDFKNTKRIHAAIDLDRFGGDLSLAGLAVRPSGTESFRPLRNIRGDGYGIALAPPSTVYCDEPAEFAAAQKRFITINAWMSRCFSQESWDQVGPIISARWMALGKQLADTPEGRSLLLLCAHLQPQPGAARTWVPLTHPLQILCSLYSGPVMSFSSLAKDVSEGSEHLALLAETSGRTIPEIHKAIGICPAFLMAFDNFSPALNPKNRLRGFRFYKYCQYFQSLDTNPGVRWFWQPGNELLGPAHYGAALGRLIDRLYDAGLEEEGANDARIRMATTIAHAASRLNEITLPTPAGLELTYGIFEFAPSFISGFARASRQNFAKEYLKAISDLLERPYRSVIGDASFLIRLAPELFAFYLLLWELSSERRLT